MAKIQLPNYSIYNTSTGYDPGIVSVASQVPLYIPMLLFFVWFVVFLGGIGMQGRRRGVEDAPMWATMASLSTFLVAMVLSIKPFLMSGLILSFVVGITILSAIWLYLSKQ